MDIPRALVITGIAVVSYLMIQAWQRDYMSPQTTPVAQEQTLADDTAPANDSDPLPQPDSAEGTVPEPAGEQQAEARGVSDRHVQYCDPPTRHEGEVHCGLPSPPHTKRHTAPHCTQIP